MAPKTGANLGLYYGWAYQEDHWNSPGVDDDLLKIDTLLQGASKSFTLFTPPSAPVEGDVYVVAQGGAGAWSGRDKNVALYTASAWTFYAPKPGWRLWDIATGVFRCYTGTQWSAEISIVSGNKGDKGDKGDPGSSAYQVAQANGYSGTQPQWLASLVGRKGDKGDKGDAGVAGLGLNNRGQWASGNRYNPNDFVYDLESDGTTSAIWIWQGAANTLSSTHPRSDLTDWIMLTAPQGQKGNDGDQGPPGAPGLSSYQVWLASGNSGTVEAFLDSLVGERGEPGVNGTNGTNGVNGTNGLSAYQVWLAQGHTGTQAEFLAALRGDQGPQGIQGQQGVQGIQGPPGTITSATYDTGTSSWTFTFDLHVNQALTVGGATTINHGLTVNNAPITANDGATINQGLTADTVAVGQGLTVGTKITTPEVSTQHTLFSDYIGYGLAFIGSGWQHTLNNTQGFLIRPDLDGRFSLLSGQEKATSVGQAASPVTVLEISSDLTLHVAYGVTTASFSATGIASFNNTVTVNNNNGNIAGGATGNLIVNSSPIGGTPTDAVIALDVGGVVATNIGMCADGYFRIGGWSWPKETWKVDGGGNTIQSGKITANSTIIGANYAISGNLAGAMPPTTNAATMGWNFRNGHGDFGFFQNYGANITAGISAFTWWQLNAGGTAFSQLLDLDKTGTLTVFNGAKVNGAKLQANQGLDVNNVPLNANAGATVNGSFVANSGATVNNGFTTDSISVSANVTIGGNASAQNVSCQRLFIGDYFAYGIQYGTSSWLHTIVGTQGFVIRPDAAGRFSLLSGQEVATSIGQTATPVTIMQGNADLTMTVNYGLYTAALNASGATTLSDSLIVNNNHGNISGGGTGNIWINATPSSGAPTDAVIAMNVQGVVATNIGMCHDGYFRIGGWSWGRDTWTLNAQGDSSQAGRVIAHGATFNTVAVDANAGLNVNNALLTANSGATINGTDLIVNATTTFNGNVKGKVYISTGGAQTFSGSQYGYVNSSGAGLSTFSGNVSDCCLQANGRIVANEVDAISDARLKDEVHPISFETGRDFILHAEPCTYIMRGDEDRQKHSGYIAQQIAKTCSHRFQHIVGMNLHTGLAALIENDGWESPKGFSLSINYMEVLPYLHAWAAGAQRKIDKLEAEVKRLSHRLLGA